MNSVHVCKSALTENELPRASCFLACLPAPVFSGPILVLRLVVMNIGNGQKGIAAEATKSDLYWMC
jgi:hypothetical protein